jgi:hypothetical protein
MGPKACQESPTARVLSQSPAFAHIHSSTVATNYIDTRTVKIFLRYILQVFLVLSTDEESIKSFNKSLIARHGGIHILLPRHDSSFEIIQTVRSDALGYQCITGLLPTNSSLAVYQDIAILGNILDSD